MGSPRRRLALLSAAACMFGAAAMTVVAPATAARLHPQRSGYAFSPPQVSYRAELAARSIQPYMPRTYRVRRDDSLSRISLRIYGTARDWTALYARNKTAIGPDPTTIRVGMLLAIPRNPARWRARYKPPVVHTAPRVSIADDASTTTTTVSSGSAQSIARSLLAGKGWSSQFGCLNDIITRESGWRVNAENASGAYGIPQALPGSKMGPGWQTSAYVQLRWMIDSYIPVKYGTPCGAWSFWQAHGWY